MSRPPNEELRRGSRELKEALEHVGVLMQLPLCSGTRLVGLVRIERLLPQKAELGDADGGLLELVSEHAGVGIETAWIRAHAREVPLQRAALERLVGS